MFEKEVAKLISTKVDISQKEAEALLETPPNVDLGDYAFPCFTLAAKMKKAPVEIATTLAIEIKPRKPIDRVEASGAYVNFFIDRGTLAEAVFSEVAKKKRKYGHSRAEKDKIMIEFSQANTHKALHVGHIRGTSLGESISRILEAVGNKVIRANYQGDTGMHVAKWIWCYQKYHSKDPLKKDESWIAGIYVDAIKRLTDDEKLQSEVDEINRKLDERSDPKLNKLWEKTRKLSLDAFETIYKDLNTKFDKYYFESEFEDRGKKIAKDLVKKKIAKISDGATIMDLEKQGLAVWVLLRKDGTVLYSAKDLALVEKKFKDFPIDKSLVITDSSQNLHFQQIKKTLELMKFKQASSYQHISYDPVRLPTGKMSSRTGENVLYSDFKNELLEYAKKGLSERGKLSKKELEDRALKIAIAAMKYPILSQGPNKVIIFDKKAAVKFEGETGPYLQYSYARASSIIRKAGRKSGRTIFGPTDSETMLLRKISEFPSVVRKAASTLNPSLIANYSYNLCQRFNEFYHNSKVIGSEEEAFRLALVDAFRATLRNALNLLGIEVMEEM